MKHTFDAVLVPRGPKGSWIFLPIPPAVTTALGSRARVAVRGTINGFPFRSSLMPTGNGTHEMMVNRGLREGAGAAAGAKVRVVLEADAAKRTVAVPADLKRALGRAPEARQAFQALSYSHQKEFVDWIQAAKRPETRTRRLGKTLELLAAAGTRAR